MGPNRKEAAVIVSPDYPPHSGGVERYSWHLAGELRKRGMDVFVVSSSMKEEPKRQEDERGVLVWRFPSLWPIPDRMPVPLPSGNWKQLESRLKEYPSVKVIVQTNLYPLSLEGVRFANQLGYSCLTIVHGSNFVCLGSGLVDRLENRYEAWLVQAQKKNGTRFAAVSQAGASFLVKLGCQVNTVAYNAIDYEEIDATSVNSPSLKEQFGLSPETVIFTYVGRLIREKGVLQLAKAFVHLQKEAEQPVALFVVGDGPLRQEMETKKGRNLFPIGQKEHRDAISILKQSDCFLLPSDSEGFPTTVLEAAACGAYVITSPFGGCREAAELVNGAVMPGNSAEDIIAACKEYLDGREAAAERAREGDRNLRNTISWSNTAEQILQALE